MNKDELKNKIKQVASQILSRKQEDKYVNLDDITGEDQFTILQKFPDLKEIILELLTKNYPLFIKEIQWVAPRPTTFRIILINNQFIFVVYGEEGWWVQIEGKQYFVDSVKDRQNALNAMSRILRYGIQDTEDLPEPKTQQKPKTTPLPDETTD